MCSAVASQFAHCFFAMLRNETVTFSEAFAMASRSVQLFCDSNPLLVRFDTEVDGDVVLDIAKERPHVSLQLVPSLFSSKVPDLPQCSTVPLEPIPEIEFLEDDVPNVPGRID